MKRPRFTLYGQILMWFFLNLALVAGVLFFVLNLQFGVGLGSLLSGKVNNRMEAIGEIMSAELRAVPRDEWIGIVSRHESAYGVRFRVIHPDGESAMMEERGEGGVPEDLLETLRNEFPRRQVGGGRAPRPEPGIRRPPGRDDRRGPGGMDDPPRLEERKFLRPRVVYYERAGDPLEYWAAVHVSLRNRAFRHPPDAVIVASSASLSGNRVFFDWRPWLWGVLAVLIGSALIWLPFVHRLTRRLRRLTAAAESISEGEFDVEVDSARGDELGRLSRAVQRMAERLDEYVSGQKRFLGDIAHELCSPLVRVRMSVGILEQKLPESEQEKLAALNEEVQDLSQLVNELLDFSKASIKPEALPRTTLVVPDLLREVVHREGPGVDIEVEAEESLTLETNPDLLRRALGNVVRNAVRYAGKGGPIKLAAVAVDGGLLLTVLDRGPGVPEEWLEKIFEPFARPEKARTREGGGAGLGLAIARTCTEGLGGTIRGWNREGGGFAVELRFAGDSSDS